MTVKPRLSGSHRTPDGVGPSRIEHSVEHGDADDGFGALRGLATSAQPRADDPLVATHRGLDQRAPPVARDLLPCRENCRRKRTEAIVGVAVLNRMLDAGRSNSVRRQASAA